MRNEIGPVELRMQSLVVEIDSGDPGMGMRQVKRDKINLSERRTRANNR